MSQSPRSSSKSLVPKDQHLRSDSHHSESRVWIERLQRDEADALRVLMNSYYTRLVNFSERYVKSYDLAEDVVQSAFIELWEKRMELANTTEILPFLYTMIRRRSISAYRAKATRDRYNTAYTDLSVDDQENQDDAQAAVEIDELTAQLRQEISSLPPRCREIFTLSRDEGLSYSQIATVLGISPFTVRTQIAKALSILRKDIKKWL